MIKNSKLYDILKFIALIALPATGTLYFTIAQIWGLLYGDEVVGTVLAVDTFLGVLLGISTQAYNNSDAKYGGVINVLTGADGTTKTYSMELHSDPATLDQQSEVAFKINPSA